MQFLAYSDIHHDDYSNGMTEEDVVSVEDQITQYAINNHINTVFFLGDWYRATNPNRGVIAQAESSWKRRSDVGIKTYVLVGNHDRWTKAIHSGHAFVAANIFKNDLENIVVYDTVEELQIDNVRFLCIPSGHENVEQLSNYRRPDNCILVALFHGLLAGSALANGATASGGIHPNILRNIGANFIFGGDNHTQQRLDDLLGCSSMYLGAPLQHNWGDRGQKRGFWHITIDPGNYNYNPQFVPTIHPRFIRTKIDAKNEMDAVMKITQIMNQELYGNSPGIVEVTLIGQYAGSINTNIIEQNLGHLNLRRFKLSVDRMYEKLEVAKGVSNLDKPEDKWAHFVSNGAQTKNLNPSLLSDMGKWAIQEARKIL